MESEEVNDLEKLRLKNIADIRNQMKVLGLAPQDSPNNFLKRRPSITRKRKLSLDVPMPTRKSARLSGCIHNGSYLDETNGFRGFSDYLDVTDDFNGFPDENDENTPIKKVIRPKLPPAYGEISGTKVGQEWAMRIECSHDGVHRPTVAGIHPGPKGAYSVVLSGGYDDDVDSGLSFTYTGSGGRDLRGTKANPKNLRTAPQSKDQELNAANAALIKNVELKMPVRVVRGYKLNSVFAPEEGYRYDGLYYVTKWWLSLGKSGFQTYKYLFTRCDDQASPPW